MTIMEFGPAYLRLLGIYDEQMLFPTQLSATCDHLDMARRARRWLGFGEVRKCHWYTVAEKLG